MPKHEFNLTIIFSQLENEFYLAESLLFPGVSRFDINAEKIEEDLKANIGRELEEFNHRLLYTKHLPSKPELGKISIEVLPSQKTTTFWRKPVLLMFHTVCWQHGEEAVIISIPALGIEVIAKDHKELDKLVEREVRAELMRRKALSSLEPLIWLQRIASLSLKDVSVSADIKTPKKLAQGEKDSKEEKNILDEVAIDLTKQKLEPAFEVGETVKDLAEVLVGRAPRSVLLVGASGVGKTATIHELVRHRSSFQLGRTPFWATSGSRLVAGMTGYGMWQERCQKVWREVSKQKAILVMGNLVELMEVGKYEGNSQGIASFFRPYLRRGDFLAIVEATTEQLAIIEKEDPHLLGIFYQIKLEEPSVEKSRSILLSSALQLSTNKKQQEMIEIEAIDELDHLHRRYAAYSAYPGRPVRFLKNILQERSKTEPVNKDEVIAAFSQETGLPIFLLDEKVAFDLEQTRNWFSSRVMGQQQSIELILDLIAMIKTGLTRSGKPLASLLFIGPTGVGKTEMAKSLAEFLFSDRERMIRFDMSEYADPVAVRRLIGETTSSEGLLTAKIREQPFSVLLLDEFEKADPSFFDLLLQVLGEGRLTDAGGKLADFCNSVVIMTSNLGADSFQHGLTGFLQPTEVEHAKAHFTKEVRKFLRPEMFNRIDRIVPFAPLNEETILQVAKKEIEKVRGRDGLKLRGVNIVVDEKVTKYLAVKGYDPKYGARPLKRMIEKEMLVPLAESLNQYSMQESLSAVVEANSTGLKVSVVAQQKKSSIEEVTAQVEYASHCASLRRDIQQLKHGPMGIEILNSIFKLGRLEKRLSSQTWKKPEDIEEVAKLSKYKQVEEQTNKLYNQIVLLEDEALTKFYKKSSFERSSTILQKIEKDWKILLSLAFSLKFAKPDYVLIAVYSEFPARLSTIAQSYFLKASSESTDIHVYRLTVSKKSEEQKEEERTDKKEGPDRGYNGILERLRVTKPDEFVSKPHQGVIGIVIVVNGYLAYPRFEQEAGLHVFINNKKEEKVLVHTSSVQMVDYLPPEGIERRGAIANQEKRRIYNLDKMQIEDLKLLKKYPLWSDKAVVETLISNIDEKLQKDTESILGGSSLL
ncbi:MAG: ATP-dependent Clp protease ATP-binding subunit [Blastocatellia bacterium]|nr:ATP-dependent Clp protease ATP-binding subunit [Blastocatellia bacterium]